jgi:hypothetical protein
MTARILTFRRPTRIAECVACGGHFQKTTSDHSICCNCSRWNLMLTGTALTMAAISKLKSEETP